MLSSILNDMRVLFIVVDLELIKFISYDFFFWLLLWLLLNDIDIMLLETLGHWVLLRPLTLVLDGSNLVMSNQFRVLLLRNSEVMVTQTTLVSDLLGDELAVMSRWNALVDDLLLRGT